MSLKAFHLVFVTASILLGLGVGGWGIIEYRANGGLEALVLGIIFLGTGIGLIFYGKRMLNKTKHIGYLTFIVLMGIKQDAAACATCYGESDAPMAEGMNAGIFVLLVIVGGTLGGIGAFFIYLTRRAKIYAKREKLLENPQLLGIKSVKLGNSKPANHRIL